MKSSQLREILSEELDLNVIEIRTAEGKLAKDSKAFYQALPLGYRGVLETDEGVRMMWDLTTTNKEDWDLATTPVTE